MNARSIPKPAPVGAAAKGVFRHPPIGSGLLNEPQWAETARALRLSGRELQIVRGVFDDHTEHAVAAAHGIADCTVHTHLGRLYRKLAVTTRVGLVLRVMDTFLHPNSPSPALSEAATTTATASAPA